MKTFFIFYVETHEVIALYQAPAVDLDRYIVEQGPEVAHALAQDGVDPRDCVIQSDGSGGWLAVSKG